MIKQKQNIENTQENIPNKKPELPKDFEKIQKEKMEIIKKTEGYENFLKFWEVEKLSQEEIQKFIEILNTISIDDLNNYIITYLGGVIFSSKNEIINFINNKLELDSNNNIEISNKLLKLLEEYEKQNPNSLTFEEKNILDNLSFKNGFQNKYKDNNTLKSFFQNKEKTKQLFDKILEKPQNKELYKLIYKNAISIDPEAENRFKEWGYDINGKITEEIPRNLYEINSIDEEVYFPDRISNLRRYRDGSMISNISTGFMDSINIKITPEGKSEVNKYGYTIKPNINFPEIKDLKIKYDKERLDIIDRININNRILDLLNNKENLSKYLENLKSQKTQEGKNANDLIIDIEINKIQKEIQMIEEKLKQAIPGYNPEQDDLLKTFLNKKVQDDKKNIIVLRENFLKEKAKIYSNYKDEIKSKYQKANDTLEFLKNIGLTFIPQNELQKIIYIINQNPSNYNFDKKIDLNDGLEGKTLDSKSQKKQLVERMSKIYEKTGENINIEDLIRGKINPYINDTTKFMGGLEKAGIFKNGIFKFEVFKELFLGLNK